MKRNTICHLCGNDSHICYTPDSDYPEEITWVTLKHIKANLDCHDYVRAAKP